MTVEGVARSELQGLPSTAPQVGAAARPARRAVRAHLRRLDDVFFNQHRGQMPISALINDLSLSPITTHTGLELPWGPPQARLFICDCAEHVLALFESALPGDARPRTCLETARRYAVAECDGATLAAARVAALEASRVLGLAASSAAMAAAECALPADFESWPVRVLWTCRRAAGEAAVERAWLREAAEQPREHNGHGDEQDLATRAHLEEHVERARVRAQVNEQSWQSHRLLEILSAMLEPPPRALELDGL